MRALPPASRKASSSRFASKRDFPRHPLRNFICSPVMGTCEPVQNVLAQFKLAFQKKYSSYAGSSTDPSHRILLSLEWLFHEIYGAGYVWYPRDRWRTAWQITLFVGKQTIGGRTDAYKRQLYRAVHHIRNPSSDHEAMK